MAAKKGSKTGGKQGELTGGDRTPGPAQPAAAKISTRKQAVPNDAASEPRAVRGDDTARADAATALAQADVDGSSVEPGELREQARNIRRASHEEIARRAYERWQQRGGQHGSHEQDWLEAERDLKGGGGHQH